MLESLKEALQLTRELDRAIKDNNLALAEHIQQKRTAVLRIAETSDLPDSVEKQKEIQAVTLEMQALEKALSKWLSEQKDNIHAEHQTQKKRQKMVKAYKDIGR